MADVSDLTLTPDELDTALAELRDAWRRRHPGILDDLIPEAIRMTEREQTSPVKLYEDYDLPRPRLPKGDERVNYRDAGDDPEPDDACYGCRFFGWGTCQLVEGSIEGTDVCDLHMPQLHHLPDLAFAESASLHPEKGTGKGGHRFHDFRRPLTFTGASEWVQFMPPPGTYQHVVYGELEFTAEKYQRIVQNFTDGTYGQTLPINAEHDSAASGAIGYITDMRIASDGSIEVKPEWNDRGTALIEGDRFRYVSAEFFESWQDPVTGTWHDDVAFGMAICTNPHFKESALRPLAASETRPPIHPTPARSRKGAAGMPNPQDKDKNPTVTLSEAEATQLRETASRVEAAEKRADTAEEQVKTLSERVSSMETQARRQRFTDLVAGRSKDGSAWFGDADKHVELLETLAAQFGEESDQVTSYTEQQQGIAQQLKSSKLFTEIGSSQSGETDVDTRVTALAEEKRKANPSLSREQAEAQVYSENPDLYAEAMNGN